MARSHIYTVHVRMWSAAGDREAKFVREGFSWGAFFFTAIWALWHRMWVAAVLLLGLTMGVSLLVDVLDIDDLTGAVIGLAVTLIIGWEANDWRRRALDRRGYVVAGVVAAPDLPEAERRFFAKPSLGQAAP